MNKKILKLLLLPWLVLPSVSCGNQTSIDTSYLSDDLKAYSYLIDDANKYLNSTTSKLLYNYHDNENNVDYCLIEADEIQNGYKKETFTDTNNTYNICFSYFNKEQLFFVKNHNVYTIKNAFLDLMMSLDDLWYVESLYNNDYKNTNINDLKIGEIGGDPIELESKGNLDMMDGYSQFEHCGPSIAVEIDPAFYNHTFTIDDFKDIDVISISRFKYGNADDGASILSGFNCNIKIPVYVLDLKDQSKEHILRTILELKKRYFVIDAFLNGARFMYSC